jgi:hypothetical protein
MISISPIISIVIRHDIEVLNDKIDSIGQNYI